MPVVNLSSGDLWREITNMLDSEQEHVCVLPMTTFIKPVRSITILQTDTKVNAVYSECPPEFRDYKEHRAQQEAPSQDEPGDMENPSE